MGNEQGGGKRKKPEDQLFDAAFEMKQQAKMLEREANKVQQQEAKEKAKVLTVSCKLIYRRKECLRSHCQDSSAGRCRP